MRGMSISIREATDPDGSPAFGWEVKFFKKSLGMGFAVEREDAEKAAAMALGLALSKQMVGSRERSRARTKLQELCERRPYLVLGVSRILISDGTYERVIREASQEEQATFEETPKSLRVVGLPKDPRSADPRDAAKRLVELGMRAGLLKWAEEGEMLEVSGKFKSFMVKQFGNEAFGLQPSEEEMNVKKAMAILKKQDKGKKGKKTKNEEPEEEEWS